MMVIRFLLQEYGLKTFTNKLSRLQLFKIASILPPRDQWQLINFDTVKQEIRHNFNLSSNELTTAINKISSHYEMANFIGKKIELLGLNYEQLLFFIDQWIRCNNEVIGRDINKVTHEEIDLNNATQIENIFKEIIENSRIKEDVWSNLSLCLTPEILAGLKSIFYFARERDFSEGYITIYKYELEEAKSNYARPDYHRDSASFSNRCGIGAVRIPALAKSVTIHSRLNR